MLLEDLVQATWDIQKGKGMLCLKPTIRAEFVCQWGYMALTLTF